MVELNAMQRKMAVDFMDESQVLTRKQWNDRYRNAELYINQATPKMLREDKETNRQLKIYLKGRFVEKHESGDWVEV